jgi:hypothetical protein
MARIKPHPAKGRYRDAFDGENPRTELHFCLYADDCNLYVKKKVRTRFHVLRSLGLKEKEVHRIGNTRKGVW